MHNCNLKFKVHNNRMIQKKRFKLEKGVLTVLGICALIVFSFLYYIYNITPYHIVTETDTIELNSSPKDSLRVVLVSDFHLKQGFPAQMLEGIVDQINEVNPDVVVFAGDLYDNYDNYHDDEKVIQELSRIDAPYGKLAVWGNRDYGGGAENHYLDILDESGFTLLQNSNWYIPLDNGKTVLFTGMDDALLGHPVLNRDTQIYDADCSIMVLHEPDEYEQYVKEEYDLALAGHSHGGQILLTPDGPAMEGFGSQYRKGLYDFTLSKLFVTSGIGTTHLSARLNVDPVISVLDLKF